MIETIVIGGIVVGFVVAVSYPIAKIFQLNRFSDYMSAQIRAFYVEQIRMIREDYDNYDRNLRFPYSIDKSYDKFNRSLPWNTNYQSMLVEND